MPPIAKENELLTATPETSARATSPATLSAEAVARLQPVALEVIVTVNGVRTVNGSDKREPFSESTKTVLVFGNGAVIRLSSSVAPGQLLFLTNEKTKKEVVCQVVKSKNYRNVSGYVELEFTEPVVGFWGVRFPGDRINSGSHPAVPTPMSFRPVEAGGVPPLPARVTPKMDVPSAVVAPKVLESKPVVPSSPAGDLQLKPVEASVVAPPAEISEVPAIPSAQTPLLQKPAKPIALIAPIPTVSATQDFPSTLAPEKHATPVSSSFDAPVASERPASILEPSPAPAAPSTLNLGNLTPFFDVKPAASPAARPPQPPVSHDPETEALKQQTARVQQQLSSLLFTDAAPAKPAQETHVAPIAEKKEEIAEATAKILETVKAPVPLPDSLQPVEPAKIAPPSSKSSLEVEELKIPAWLEPLARNAAAPASTHELIEREKAKRLAEQVKVEKVATEPEPPAAVEEDKDKVFELPVPSFGNSLPISEHHHTSESGSGSSGKGILIGAIAAGVLLLAGGAAWYVRQQSAGAHGNTFAVSQSAVVAAPASSLPAQSQANTSVQTDPRTPSNAGLPIKTPPQSNSNSNPPGVAAVSMSTPEARGQQGVSPSAKGSAAITNSDSPRPEPAPAKKPSLGAVHLAAPKITQRGSAQVSADAAAGLSLNDVQVAPQGEALGAGLAGNSRQPAAPAAPLPVGGDVKQARLVSSVPPVYPILAKNQHVSGDVRIDALIDPNGRVTTMKIISGPALLHQAAMDALRQWKYQPALLDGKPVSMHLSVTIQFRLQ